MSAVQYKSTKIHKLFQLKKNFSARLVPKRELCVNELKLADNQGY